VLRLAISARVLGTGFACGAPPRIDLRSVAVQLRTDILARLPSDLVHLGRSGGEARVPDHTPGLVLRQQAARLALGGLGQVWPGPDA
jgi:hypothetical protein